MSETEAILCGGLTGGGRIQEDLFIIRLVEEREIQVEVRHMHGLGESYPLDKNIVFYFFSFLVCIALFVVAVASSKL